MKITPNNRDIETETRACFYTVRCHFTKPARISFDDLAGAVCLVILISLLVYLPWII